MEKVVFEARKAVFMRLHRFIQGSYRLASSVIFSFLMVAPCGCGRPPNATVSAKLNSREPSRVEQRRGIVVAADQEQAIIAIETPSGRKHTVRPAPIATPNGRTGIWAVAGPDAKGLVAFVEEYFPTPSHALKVIRLDGSAERTIFKREGDPIWKDAIGKHLAFSPIGGRVALVGQMRGVQMPSALLNEGPLEVWNLAGGTRAVYGRVLDEGIAWFPDGHRLACVRLLPRESLPRIEPLNDGFGKLWAHWDRGPVVSIVDIDNGREVATCEGVEPVISTDGRTLLVADFPTNAGVHWRQVRIDTGAATAVGSSSSRTYLAFDGAGSSIYLQPPLPGEPVNRTKYYSPLHGPSDLLSLWCGPLGQPPTTADRVAEGFDPRQFASFGRPR